jgi:hypothetical protein
VACSICGEHWSERSVRGVLDWLADFRERALFWFLCGMVALGSPIAIYAFVKLLVEAAPRIGDWDASGFGVIFFLAALSSVVLAYWWYLRDRE